MKPNRFVLTPALHTKKHPDKEVFFSGAESRLQDTLFFILLFQCFQKMYPTCITHCISLNQTHFNANYRTSTRFFTTIRLKTHLPD